MLADRPITWSDITLALNHMAPTKAPGDDNIPVSFLRTLCYAPLPNTRPNHAASHLLNLCHRIFDSPSIPACWRTATVASIPKKGDPLNPSDYRGISLINTTMKVVAKIVQRRLDAFTSTNNLLAREQA
eukprot:jgi/Hompol1/3072/HPOL_006325-RA